MKLNYEEIKEKLISQLNTLNIGIDEDNEIIISLLNALPYDQH
jgi:hypothetical protein